METPHFGILEILGLGLTALEMIGVLPRIRGYFNPQRRTQRAVLFSQIAKDVLSLVTLQKGVTTPQAEIIQSAMDMVMEKLIREGVSKAQAADIARSTVAGAAAQAGFDLKGIVL